MNAQGKQYAGIDYFRLVAAVLIVTIHTSPLESMNGTADFILTRIIARVAVPFFFMASGFFLLGGAEGGKPSLNKAIAFEKKTAVLYGAALFLYLPLNFYAGTIKEWRFIPNLLKDIVFNGTFYHLWYLPAAMLGFGIAWILLNRLKPAQALVVTLILYIIGLFGDSYYGISEKIPFLTAAYKNMFFFFDYTRNGLFFAPVFFILGALLARQKERISASVCLTGFGVSFILMLAEGLLLHHLDLQKHDSMYIMLLPSMFFLFQSLLFWKGKGMKSLRDLSMLIYLLHPAVIVLVRGFAKVTGLQKLLIENSVLHFGAVMVGSLLSAALLVKILYGLRSRKGIPVKRTMERAWAEIDMGNLRHNAGVLQNALPSGCQIMAVVKANAYGHGSAEVAVCLNRIGIHTFAVATIDEGINLRQKGIKGSILVLGYTPATRAVELYRHHLLQTVADVEHAQELNRFGKALSVHIKVNTGMNRLGENSQHVSEIASILACSNLKVEGIFTHLSVADSREEADVTFSNLQIQSFYKLLDALKAEGIPIPSTHIQSSYGILNYPWLQCSYARIGIALYGVLSKMDTSAKEILDLKPVMSLKAKVVLIRMVEPGESVSYGREFEAQVRTKIAVLSIGYADGVPRCLFERESYVLIGGHRAPIVGRICMDQFMVDVTGFLDVKRGDVATLIGKDGSEEICAETMAESAGTITNELLSRLSDHRLERVFINE